MQTGRFKWERRWIRKGLLGNAQLLPAALLWSGTGAALSAGPLLISLSSHINPARSHATVLSPIINRFLNKDLCLDLKHTHPHVCVCVWGGQSVPSGVIHCEPTVWCIWETPLCFQRGIFHFAAKHSPKCWSLLFFGGAGGLGCSCICRSFWGSWTHRAVLQRGSGGVVLLQGKPGGRSCSVLSCSGGISTRVGVCFLPSLFPASVQIGSTALAFSMKQLPVVFTPLWVLQFNQTPWNWTMTQIGANTMGYFSHAVASRWHCSFYDAPKTWTDMMIASGSAVVDWQACRFMILPWSGSWTFQQGLFACTICMGSKWKYAFGFVHSRG